MTQKATLEKNYVIFISRRTISHSQMTTGKPKKVFVLTRILETNELCSMLDKGVESHPLSLPSAAPDAAGHLGHKATLVICVSLRVHYSTRVSSAKLFTSPQPVCVSAWGFFLQRWDLAFLSAKLHEVPVRPALQPLKVRLNGSANTWCFIHYFQYFVIYKVSFCSIA